MPARHSLSFATVVLSLAGVAAGCSSAAGVTFDQAPLAPDAGPASDGATSDATTPSDAAPRDASPSTDDGSDTGLTNDDAGADAEGSDGGPLDAASAETGADANVSSDADTGPDANGSPDAGDDAGGSGPCAAMPFVTADGGAAIPSRAWCDAFGYPTYPQDLDATLVHVNAGFSGDGGVTLLGAVGESSLTYAITVAGKVLPGGSPFAIALDPAGAPVNAYPLSAGSIPDAGVPSLVAWAGAVGTGGDLAIGGAAFGPSYPIDGALWTFASNGSPEAAEFFTSSNPGYDAQVGSIAPIAGGDFIVAGTFTSGTVFGTTPLTAPGTYDTFVARFAPGGGVRWVTAVGEVSPGPNGPIDVVADVDGHVSLVTMGIAADGGYEGLAARFDAATGARQWVRSIVSGFPAAEAVAPDGDDLVVMLSTVSGYQAVGLHGADGSPRYQGPVVGQSSFYASQVNAMVSDGAGGTIVTGMTYGGSFGSISIPSNGIAQCFLAGADASGNPTWLTLCSALQYAVGLDLIVSGKKVVLTGASGFAPVGGTQLITFAEEYVLP